jgi:TatD DNase family protein
MKYIDIHCHLDREDYGSDFKEVLARMKEREVGAIAIGADLPSSKKAVEIAEQNKEIWACIGVHPEDPTFSFDKQEFEELVKSPKVVGIGECGLDYSRPEWADKKAEQKNLFIKQVEFAIKYDKPLMLHIRSSKNSFDAYDDALEILNNYKKEAGEKLRGNVHFFAGDTEIAKKFLDLGFTMSFTGVITFTHDYDEVIKFIPQDSIMSETDAPFVAPVPFRGKRNEPVYVIEIVKKLAEIRGENFDVLNSAILANTKRAFAF